MNDATFSLSDRNKVLTLKLFNLEILTILIFPNYYCDNQITNVLCNYSKEENLNRNLFHKKLLVYLDETWYCRPMFQILTDRLTQQN